jgi:murein L,D-transpeptidase YafK
MKRWVVLLVFGMALFASCRENPDSMPDLDRAAAAEANVRPALERDLAALGLHYGDPVFLRAFKEERILELWLRKREDGRFVLFRTYPIAASSGDLGPKLKEGDGQVPEGFYFVPPRAMNPNSVYHLAFNIGFPNAYDLSQGRTGSFIMVHGSNVSIGCLAMTDAKIEEIYSLCAAAHRAGQPFFRVHLFPFRMSAARLSLEAHSPHVSFWKNLKEGYDKFENERVPLDAHAAIGRYVFE